MWDNRTSKKNPKQPDYRCKDRDNCDGAVWLKGKAASAPGAGSKGNGGSSAGGAPKRPLGPLYWESMKIAKATLDNFQPKGYSGADLVAATATIFIGANQSGAPMVAPPKPKPEPPTTDDDRQFDTGDDFEPPY